MSRFVRTLVLGLSLAGASLCRAQDDPPRPTQAIRVATFNLEDVRTEDLAEPSHPRLRRLAEVIQRVRPTVLLLNEIAFDEPGAPGVADGATPGTNAQRFADAFLAVPQAPGLRPLRYKAFAARSNTGLPSGLDLDRSGSVVTTYPPPPPPNPDGTPGPQSDEARAYGGDCWGFGTFPGQYAMALLVDERLEILTEDIRTFRLLPWSYMPNALLPMVPVVPPAEGEQGEPPGEPEPWYSGAAADTMRLSSKSHWDVPVRLPGGSVVHILASHPTPPAFDGPEGRNKRRNHDEIRFWADYLAGAAYIVDDAGKAGGLPPGAHFVIVGDLNADPQKGSSLHNPIGLLLASPRLAQDPAPTSEIEIVRLDPGDTAMFRLRVDYALPSATLEVLRSGVWRHPPAGGAFPSDHFPVWVDVGVPTGP